MKKENKPTKKETEPTKKETEPTKKDLVNQNVYDFNPSQFTTDEELEIIKRKKEEAKKKEEIDKLKDKED